MEIPEWAYMQKAPLVLDLQWMLNIWVPPPVCASWHNSPILYHIVYLAFLWGDCFLATSAYNTEHFCVVLQQKTCCQEQWRCSSGSEPWCSKACSPSRGWPSFPPGSSYTPGPSNASWWGICMRKMWERKELTAQARQAWWKATPLIVIESTGERGSPQLEQKW